MRHGRLLGASGRAGDYSRRSRRLRVKRLIAPVALACAVLVARPPIAAQGPPAAFEAVSVKPDLNPVAPIGIRPVIGNRFSAVVTVNLLVAVAYGERSTLL